MAILKPLSAEQLAWSLMEASGQCAPQRQAAERTVSGDPRLDDIYETDAKRRYLRDQTIEEYVYGKLNGVVGSFASLYGGAEGEPEQDFNATVHQALFLSNGSTIRGWLNPSGGNLIGRTQSLEDPRRVADELYQAILSRDPSDEERLHVAEYLVRRAETPLIGAGNRLGLDGVVGIPV